MRDFYIRLSGPNLLDVDLLKPGVLPVTEDRYDINYGSYPPVGKLTDERPFPTAQLYKSFASRRFSSPGKMPGQGKCPVSNQLLRTYAPKSKYAYRAAMDLDAIASYHLSLGHEIIHARHYPAEWWKESIIAIILLIAATWTSLIVLLGMYSILTNSHSSHIVALLNTLKIALPILIVLFIFEVVRIIKSKAFKGTDREEVVVEIGASLLGMESGVMKGLSDYSSYYIAIYLSKFEPNKRKEVLQECYDVAVKRYQALRL